jgi:hypothetical protein
MKNPDSLAGGPGQKENQQCRYNRFPSHSASNQTTSRRRTVPRSDWESPEAHAILIFAPWGVG